MEPEMNLRRQARKADIARLEATLRGEHQKADYIGYLARHMISEAEAGRPQPWSRYEPRVAEEFGE